KRMGEAYDYIEPKRGDIREGEILCIRPGEIVLDIGLKQDALVAAHEVQEMDPKQLNALKVGDRVYVYVVRTDRVTGTPIVSLQLAREYEEWQRAHELLDSGEIIRVRVTGYNKGGALCVFGNLQGFIPASQIVDLRRGRAQDAQTDALAEMVGRELAVKVIEVNRRRRRLILSERAARREWRAQQREQLLAELEEGQIRTGVVSNLVDFGAFVDLGGIDGLIHLSELSWGRVEHPGEILKIGDEVEVYVLNVDRERQRIGLSLKRTQPDPWADVEARYRPGQLVTGRVTHLVEFGAFVELEPGVEGLVHISELDQSTVMDASHIVQEGQELTLLVLNVDAERHRISLSLSQAPDQADEAAPAEETGNGGEQES
ncbi:MAG: S1 RNA-binding domain-containing protein, partial [Chloroflexi bacterium]|nr:S1 RNA-binding domain-containing protein [Chloroflexota bacterium]